jgi:hypothetical protein
MRLKGEEDLKHFLLANDWAGGCLDKCKYALQKNLF